MGCINELISKTSILTYFKIEMTCISPSSILKLFLWLEFESGGCERACYLIIWVIILRPGLKATMKFSGVVAELCLIKCAYNMD